MTKKEFKEICKKYNRGENNLELKIFEGYLYPSKTDFTKADYEEFCIAKAPK